MYILIDRNSANDSISVLIIIHTHSHSHTHGSVLQLRDSKCYATFIFITYARFSFLFSAFCFPFSFFSVYDCLAFLYIPAFVLLHYLIRSFWDFFAYFHFVTFFYCTN